MIGFIIYSSSLLFLYRLGFSKKNIKVLDEELHYQLSDVTLVIPFRNESVNLDLFCNSLIKQSVFPKQIIFVNDHSSDNSIEILSNYFFPTNVKILNVADNQFGKKEALRTAFDEVETKYVLTMDADVVIPNLYFEEIEKLSKTDLSILPVKMISSNRLNAFYELDYYLLNAINYALSSWNKPIVSSGANLLFDLEKFRKIDSYDFHYNQLSGDDMFLLHDFMKSNAKIKIIKNESLAVSTNVPNSFLSFLKQRIRWIKKTSSLKNSTASLVGFLGGIYNLYFLVSLFLFPSDFIWIILFKIITDYLLFKPYISFLKRNEILPSIPFYSLFYPVYLFLILFCLFFMKNDWKGRRV